MGTGKGDILTVMARKRISMARKTTLDRLDRSFDLELWRQAACRRPHRKSFRRKK